MSLFSSFLTAETQLEAIGYQKLGHSLGGTSDRTFWICPEDGAVAEGHALFGDAQERYRVSVATAEDALYPSLVSIRRSQFPQWTRQDCEENALSWCALLGYSPARPDDVMARSRARMAVLVTAGV